MNRNTLQLLGVSISSMLIGGGIGYIVAEKRLAAAFDERLLKETEEMREFYTVHRKKYPTATEAAKDLIPEALLDPKDPEVEEQRVAYHKIVKKEYTEGDEQSNGTEIILLDEVVHSNVFESPPREEPKNTEIYVISVDEYMQNEAGFEQATLTYYTKDNVLGDSRDEAIEDVDRIAGMEFHEKFGFESGDPNTVHVRNMRLAMDFEIVRSEGSFAHEVMGLDDE